MKSLGLFALAFVITAVVFVRASEAQGFVADRDFLLSKCQFIPLYECVGKECESIKPAGSKKLRDKAPENIELILRNWEQFGDGDKRKLAYVLATAFRETQGTFEPIREAPRCGTDEQCRERALGSYADAKANGRRYYGRGYSQLTGEKNYAKLGKVLEVDLVSTPDLALQQELAATILVRGMLEGLFSSQSRRLGVYFDGDKEEWDKAREIVNPNTRRKKITGAHARDINACLKPG
jgi:hypothetical protein